MAAGQGVGTRAAGGPAKKELASAQGQARCERRAGHAEAIGVGVAEILADVAGLVGGRDPAGLTVVVRANVPLTREPLGDGRPFLGGSPRQIAEDLARLEPAGVDEVLFSSIRARDTETEVGLLAELQSATAATA